MIAIFAIVLIVSVVCLCYLIQEDHLKRQSQLDDHKEWLNKIYRMPSARKK